MNSWTYPISGDIHYFTKAKPNEYGPSGVLRSVALFLDQVNAAQPYSTVESMMFYPEGDGWSAMVALYHDKPQS